MLNEINLIGRVGWNEVGHTGSGVAKFEFSLVTTESFKGKDGEWETKETWHKCVMWGDRAVSKSKRIKKGTLLHVKGRLQIGIKLEEETGKKLFYPSVTCDRVTTLANYVGSSEDTAYDSKFNDIAKKNDSVSGGDDFNIFKEKNDSAITVDDIPF